MDQEITLFKSEDFNIDCESSCSKSENEYYCYRRIGSHKELREQGCKDCRKYKNERN
jgi:hypothetical protein